ncbi:MAG: helix-turn-helix domain-containing protein [Pseudomonas sp.]|jgi:DNA-binding HxlR family transcriptional regulator|uniref:winged helix-turn-helix transcriptional regulator n=1 Tax=Pseudomonas sp. TaxID=306 RepID=UPI00238BA637|nr:helix-turn-helix domain-containing protein [Pseudomonas sp.]MDE1194460.1 helix-turn-helix domain-containing protein [Pseudomonas sp.]
MNDIASPSSENVSLLERIRMGEILARDCPSREILNHVCSRWGVLVLVVLLDGMHRFSELRRKIGGVSEKMLSQTLQSLEQDGFIDRKALPVVPPHVEYSLTPLGVEVAKQVDGLTTWIEQNLPRIMEARQAREAAVAQALTEPKAPTLSRT